MMTVTWGVFDWVYDFHVVEFRIETCILTSNHQKCSWLDKVCPILRTAAGDYRHMHPI